MGLITEIRKHLNLKGHSLYNINGITGKDYEAASDKTAYTRKVPLDDGTWKNVSDFGGGGAMPTDYITGGSQTTTSTANGGNNVFTFKKADGTTATFTVKNGTQGSAGARGSMILCGNLNISVQNNTPFVISGLESFNKQHLEIEVNDLYIDTRSYNVYWCSVRGNVDSATFVYQCNIKGKQGDSGVATVELTGTGDDVTAVNYNSAAQTVTLTKGTRIKSINSTLTNGNVIEIAATLAAQFNSILNDSYGDKKPTSIFITYNGTTPATNSNNYNWHLDLANADLINALEYGVSYEVVICNRCTGGELAIVCRYSNASTSAKYVMLNEIARGSVLCIKLMKVKVYNLDSSRWEDRIIIQSNNITRL